MGWECGLLSQKYSSSKERDCRQQPFNAPQVQSLPIQQRWGGKQKANPRGRHNTNESTDHRDQGCIGLSQEVPQGIKIKPCSPRSAAGTCASALAVRAADVAEAGTQHEIRAAILARLCCRVRLELRAFRNVWLPELFPLFLIK